MGVKKTGANRRGVVLKKKNLCLTLFSPLCMCVYTCIYVCRPPFFLSLFVCEHVSARQPLRVSVPFVAVFVNVTQDSQMEGAIVNAGGQRE